MIGSQLSHSQSTGSSTIVVSDEHAFDPPKVQLYDEQIEFRRKFKARTWAQYIFMTVEEPTFSWASKGLSGVVTALIILSVITFIIETMETMQDIPNSCELDSPRDNQCRRVPKNIFMRIEWSCMLMFSLEYILRVTTVHSVPGQIWQSPSKAGGEPQSGFQLTMAYVLKGINLIDLLAILPFWVEVVFSIKSSFGVLRIVRLTRMLRMLKSPSIRTLVAVIRCSIVESASALAILAFFSMMAIVLIGTLAFMAEAGTWTTDPDDLDLCCSEEDRLSGDRRDCLGCYKRPTVDGHGFEASPFKSIPLGMYWVIVTMTTVGYGDLAPHTTWGRIIAIFTTYCGIIALALPITVIGNNFTRAYEELRDEQKRKMGKKALSKRVAGSLRKAGSLRGVLSSKAIRKKLSNGLSSRGLLGRRNTEDGKTAGSLRNLHDDSTPNATSYLSLLTTKKNTRQVLPDGSPTSAERIIAPNAASPEEEKEIETPPWAATTTNDEPPAASPVDMSSSSSSLSSLRAAVESLTRLVEEQKMSFRNLEDQLSLVTTALAEEERGKEGR